MTCKRLSQQQSTIGLRVALRIISAWQATPAQACGILRISASTFRRVSQGVDAGRRLDLDQQQRIGMVLGIHACLRTVFDNPANVQGFPSLTNHNPFFEGRSPIEIMANGDMISFYETYKRIEQFQLGQH
ncbi:antitoxin Xre-like helix-turn-helix domain-containing protein [Pseudomonas alliivorans]|nr:antitoxin Xre-like helix-turn-helix domain-containing protein [Pseudomonas alliivorans]